MNFSIVPPYSQPTVMSLWKHIPEQSCGKQNAACHSKGELVRCWNRINKEGVLQKGILACNWRAGFDNPWVLSSSGYSVILWRCPFLTMKYCSNKSSVQALTLLLSWHPVLCNWDSCMVCILHSCLKSRSGSFYNPWKTLCIRCCGKKPFFLMGMWMHLAEMGDEPWGRRRWLLVEKWVEHILEQQII